MTNKHHFSISMPRSNDWQHFELIPSNNIGNMTIAPFHGPEKHFDTIPSSNWKPHLSAYDNSKSELNKGSYIELIKSAINYCDTEEKKVVCSRSQFFNTSIHIDNWLEKLRTAFPAAFIYLLEIEGDVWIGASPEMLVKQNGENLETHSLAGTKWDDDPFTHKEYQEQAVVTESILKWLSLDNSHASITREIAYGQVRHLETTIEWKSNKPGAFETALKQLHPTPAVCGLPREEAQAFILRNEPYSRELYTGYIALEINGVSNAFVNLRCAKVFSDGIQMFAGGGINMWSNPETEWEETNEKMNAIRNVLIDNGQD